ncbi:MAG TPA: AEC family transporter [Thermoflexia bacterium]|nr:AEC family transporter [Thermoflexia bacterium]
MTTLFNVILPVALVAVAAAVAEKWLELDLRTLSRSAFYLFMPALVLEVLVQPDLKSDELRLIAGAAVLVTVALWAIFEVVARLLRLEPQTRGAFLTVIVLTNAGTYGLPVLTFAFGEDALAPAAAYLLTFNVVLVFLASLYLAVVGQSSLRKALRRVGGAPLVYAALLGMALRWGGWTLPEPVLKAVQLLSQAAIPTLLVVLGLQLRRGLTGGWRSWHLPALGMVLVARFLVAPLLAGWIGNWIGLQGLAHTVFVIDNALPTAITTTVLTSEFESDAQFATVSVFLTTVVSLLTVTLWINWLR